MITLKYFRNLLLLALAATLPASNLHAGSLGSSDPAGLADREIIRRQSRLQTADELAAEAEKEFKAKNYEAAYVKYLDALDNIPEGEAFAGKRRPLIAKFAQAADAYARDLISKGRFQEAEMVAKTVLLPQYDPKNHAAISLLSRLEQPDDFNKTITPAFAADREQVIKLLREAQGFFDSGRFDLATKRYEQVLLIDPYNNAARLGMERVDKERSKYYGEAYNETRSRLLWQVDRKWERPVNRNLTIRATDATTQIRGNVRGNEAIMAKLNSIIIPRIDLRDTTVREAIQFLQQRSRDLDPSTDDPAQKRGVNIVLKLPPPGLPQAETEAQEGIVPPETAPQPVSGTADTTVTMRLTNVPLIEAIRYLTELANLKFKVEPFAVAIVPITENTTDLITKEYRVPPGFIPATGGAEAGALAPGVDISAQRVRGRINAKAYLESQQVPFPEGATAQYVPAGSKLIVRNTPDNLDLIDFLVDAAMGVQPTQVEIESKFIEISQTNLEELGFDWLVGPFSIGRGTYGSGGTEGFNRQTVATTLPFGTVGSNPLTGGLRSGVGNSPDAAVTANSIDALIQGFVPGASATAPATFGIAGVFTNPQFQAVIRALSQKKGVDLMSAPKVTTKSGRKAVVRVVREFPYPTEFNPPEVPQADETIEINAIIGVVTTSGIVTPTTPTAFETRNLGVTLEVEPIIGPDNYTIDLTLAPEVVEFDGFINYGSPVFGATTSLATLSAVPFEVTPNVINQPIFSTRKITTSVSIWDGQTVALGGLIREDIQKTQDKVPILGDIPLAGRLFRANVDQKIKRNLIVFVTARIMDAEGRPIREDDADQEEIVEPLGLPSEIPPPAMDSPSFGK